MLGCMMKLSIYISILAFFLYGDNYAYAQHHTHQHSEPAVNKVEEAPGTLWLLLSEAFRNLDDAFKQGDTQKVEQHAQNMKNLVSRLVQSNVGDEVRPHESEQVIQSLSQLEQAVESVLQASAIEDEEKKELGEAILKLSGALTLAKIDVPPGFVESMSGSNVRAEVISPAAIKKDEPQDISVRLKHAVGGKPLMPEDFDVVHTKIIHGLIVDPSLSDYKHIHPQATDAPGEYVFSITPGTDCSYRLWLDVKPKGRNQEFAVLDIPGTAGCGNQPIDKTENSQVSLNGYDVTMEITEGSLAQGQNITLSFDIKDSEGQSLSDLEPLMGAYAHVVGFYDDYRSIAHLHPLGAEPQVESDRGAAPLLFHFSPDRAGFVKLFLQVSVKGEELFFPFGVIIPE